MIYNDNGITVSVLQVGRQYCEQYEYIAYIAIIWSLIIIIVDSFSLFSNLFFFGKLIRPITVTKRDCTGFFFHAYYVCRFYFSSFSVWLNIIHSGPFPITHTICTLLHPSLSNTILSSFRILRICKSLYTSIFILTVPVTRIFFGDPLRCRVLSYLALQCTPNLTWLTQLIWLFFTALSLYNIYQRPGTFWFYQYRIPVTISVG